LVLAFSNTLIQTDSFHENTQQRTGCFMKGLFPFA